MPKIWGSRPPTPGIDAYESQHSFIPDISKAPLQVHYLTTTQRRFRLQHWYCVGVNTPKRYKQLELRTCPRSIHVHAGQSGILICDLPDARHRTYHWAQALIQERDQLIAKATIDGWCMLPFPSAPSWLICCKITDKDSIDQVTPDDVIALDSVKIRLDFAAETIGSWTLSGHACWKNYASIACVMVGWCTVLQWSMVIERQR